MLDIFAKATLIATFAFVVAVIGFSAWHGSMSADRPQRPPISQQGRADKKNTKADDNNVFVKLFSRIGWFVRLLDRHNGLVSAIGTLFVALFTGVLVVATAALFYSSEKVANSAKDSADVAEKTLVATNRPWVKIKSITLDGPLAFEPSPNDHEGRLDFKFVLENTGKSPAVRIWLDVRLTISNIIDLRAEQKIFCDALRDNRMRAATQPMTIRPEMTLFPGDEITMKTQAWMNPEPLAKFREWAGKIPGASVFPAIVGCVLYEFTFDKGHHQTGIIYNVLKRTPYPNEHPLPSYAKIPEGFPITNQEGAVHLEGSIPASDLTIQRNFVGTGPID